MSKIIRKKRLKIQSGRKGLEGILAHQSTVKGHNNNNNNNNNHKIDRQTNMELWSKNIWK